MRPLLQHLRFGAAARLLLNGVQVALTETCRRNGTGAMRAAIISVTSIWSDHSRRQMKIYCQSGVSRIARSLAVRCRNRGECRPIEPKPEGRERSDTGGEVHGTQRAGNSRETRKISQHHG